VWFRHCEKLPRNMASPARKARKSPPFVTVGDATLACDLGDRHRGNPVTTDWLMANLLQQLACRGAVETNAQLASLALDRQPNGCILAVMNDDAVFRALADASRRRLLDRLHRKNGQTLGDLCEGLDLTRQAVAKHLAILEKANLVSWKRRGREKLHFINPVPINEIAERWISKFERQRLTALSELKKKLERRSDN
jgi:DNA-binding transcriptional ArsR family regulator